MIINMGLTKCSVLGCEKNSAPRHRFPNFKTDLPRFKKWLDILQNKGLNTMNPNDIYNRKVVCHAHFEGKYISPGTKRLHIDAIPTLHLNNEISSGELLDTLDGNINISTPSSNISEENESIVQLRDTIKLENMPGNNFSKLCRSCMSNGEFDIFSTLFESQPIVTLLQQLVTEQISPNDHLPKIICDQCLNMVISHYVFLKNYQTVQVRLRKIFEENVIEEKPTFSHISDCDNSGILNNCNSDYDDDPIRLQEHCKKEETVFSTVSNFELNHNENQNEIQNVRTPNHESSELPQKDDSNKVDDRGRQKIDDISTGEFVNVVEIYYVSSEENVNPIPNATNDCQRSIKEDIDKTSGKRHCKYSTKKLKKPIHSCSECSQSFQFIKDLRQHCRDTGHKYPRTHTCEICQKKLSSYSYLVKHMKLHSEERPFVCEECGMSFTLEAYLKTHKKMVHGNREPLICEVCGKVYRKKHSLVVHLRKHKGETPFKCDCCGKGFYRKYSLMYHLHMHHGKDIETIRHDSHKRQCKLCGKTLSRSGFYAHMKIRHGEKSTCSICGKILVSKAALDLHMNTHNKSKPYKCKICLKSYLQLTNLKTHMLVHTGERPFCCDKCGAGFKQSSHLINHQKTHTDVKPYSCTFCKKRFALKGNMAVHMKTHTGETTHHCRICNRGFFDSSARKRHETNVHKLHSHKKDDYSGIDRGKKRLSPKKIIVENVDQSIEESNSSI